MMNEDIQNRTVFIEVGSRLLPRERFVRSWSRIKSLAELFLALQWNVSRVIGGYKCQKTSFEGENSFG